MPPVSQAQRRAMYAAAEGKSNLGIPKSVGQEFEADDHVHGLPERKDPPKPLRRKSSTKQRLILD